MIVRLTRQELAECRQAATARWQLARASGVNNQRRDSNKTDNDIDFLGICGEVATAKALSIDYSPRAIGMDDGMDMWAAGMSIDVKATFHENGRLLFKSINSFAADIAILVTPTQEEGCFNVVGGISRLAFGKNHVAKDLGHGEGVMVDQDQLCPLKDIWEYITARRVG